jgi:hypothetical protein
LGQVFNIYNFWPYSRSNVFNNLLPVYFNHLTFWENFQKFYMRLIVVETMNHKSYIVID